MDPFALEDLEDALDEDFDVDLFPAIDAQAVVTTAPVEDDPLEVNPVYLIDEEEMSEDDDQVSLLSMNNDMDVESLDEFFGVDVDGTIPLQMKNDDSGPSMALTDYHYTDNDYPARAYLCQDSAAPAQNCTAFAQV